MSRGKRRLALQAKRDGIPTRVAAIWRFCCESASNTAGVISFQTDARAEEMACCSSAAVLLLALLLALLETFLLFPFTLLTSIDLALLSERLTLFGKRLLRLGG